MYLVNFDLVQIIEHSYKKFISNDSMINVYNRNYLFINIRTINNKHLNLKKFL